MGLAIAKFDNNTYIEDERILLIDGHNIAYITVFNTLNTDYSDNDEFVLWKNNFLNRIFDFVVALEPTKIVLVFDVKNSWRYEIFPNYKSARKNKIDHSKKPLNKKKFLIALESLITDIVEYFPSITTIKVDRAEGDDIIAVLSKDVFNKDNHEVIIVSGDTDLNQLISLRNVKQYDPKKNQYFNVLNPKRELDIKILKGDTSDSIPSIKYKVVGIVKAAEILGMSNGVDTFIDSYSSQLERDTIRERFELNTKLINLDFIPNDVRCSIIESYKNIKNTPVDGKKLMNYLFKNKLKSVRSRWNSIAKYLE